MNSPANIPNASHCTLCPLQTACLAELAGCVDVRRLSRGQHLCRPGDDADSVYVVREGALKTYVNSAAGAEQILAFHIMGDVVGLDSALSEEVGRSGTVALGSASVCRVPVSRVMLALAKSSSLRKRLMQGMGNEIRRLQRMLGLERCTAEQRVASFLISELRKAQRLQPSQRRLQLPMSRGEIGRFLGLATETVSRMFTALERRGIFTLAGAAVTVLDVDSLVRAAQGLPTVGSTVVNGASRRTSPVQRLRDGNRIAQSRH